MAELERLIKSIETNPLDRQTSESHSEMSNMESMKSDPPLIIDRANNDVDWNKSLRVTELDLEKMEI